MRTHSGLNSAAATSVEAATPTRPESASVLVVSAIRPMKVPASSAVSIAYESVRLTSRSISYSR